MFQGRKQTLIFEITRKFFFLIVQNTYFFFLCKLKITWLYHTVQMFETSFLWQGRVIVFPSVFCSWGRPVNAVRACDAISQGTVPLAQVGKIFTWKRGFRALSSRVGGGWFCSSIFKQLQLRILSFVSVMGVHLSVSLTFSSEVSFHRSHPASFVRL